MRVSRSMCKGDALTAQRALRVTLPKLQCAL